tara:strand:+ start:1970 stop:2242 length:273 start_codon:yes stop_codon:yes gene_type:complete
MIKDLLNASLAYREENFEGDFVTTVVDDFGVRIDFTVVVIEDQEETLLLTQWSGDYQHSIVMSKKMLTDLVSSFNDIPTKLSFADNYLGV